MDFSFAGPVARSARARWLRVPAAVPDAAAAVDVLVVGAGPGGQRDAPRSSPGLGYRRPRRRSRGLPRDKACSEYMSPETVRLLDAARRGGRARGGGRPAPGHGGHRALGAAGSTAGSRWPGHRRSARPASRSRGASWTTRCSRPRARPAPRCWSAPPWRSCSTIGGAVAGVVARDREGRRRTHPGPAHDRRRRAPLHRRPADRPARATGGPAGSRSWPTSMACRAWAAPPSCTSARDGYVGTQPDRRRTHQRGAGGAGRAGRSRRAGGRRRSFSRRSTRSPACAARVEPADAWSGRCWPPARSRAWSGRVVADGAALVGDAADFFDPFTGEGIYSALLRRRRCSPTRPAGALADRGPVTGRRARALSPRAPAGLRRQVGGRAADRLRHAVPGAVRPRRRAARPSRGHGRHARRASPATSCPPAGCSIRCSSRGCCSEPDRESIPPASASCSAASRPGVTVLTVRDPEGRPAGMTASSLASVSLEPPLVSVCVDHTAELHDLIIAAPEFVVNVLESAPGGALAPLRRPA